MWVTGCTWNVYLGEMQKADDVHVRLLNVGADGALHLLGDVELTQADQARQAESTHRIAY